MKQRKRRDEGRGKKPKSPGAPHQDDKTGGLREKKTSYPLAPEHQGGGRKGVRRQRRRKNNKAGSALGGIKGV